MALTVPLPAHPTHCHLQDDFDAANVTVSAASLTVTATAAGVSPPTLVPANAQKTVSLDPTPALSVTGSTTNCVGPTPNAAGEVK
jgi:hypothetical protein